MAQQRQVSPIPPGRYWITVTGRDNIADFDQWLRDMGPAVRVEASSLGAPEGPLFVIFVVPTGRAPVLNAAQFGFPSHAPPSVTSIDDVEQAPIIEPPSLREFGEGFGSFMRGAGEGLGFAGLGTLVLIFVVLHALEQSQPRRRVTRRAA